jgi:predicted O-methyltransferase YrrM
MLHREEFKKLIMLIGDARSVLEIGVHRGRTAKYILETAPMIERYVGVDVPPTYKAGLAVQQNEIPKMPGEFARGDSRFKLVIKPRGSFDLKASDLLPKFDAIFIDGDHSRAAVENDTALAESLINETGIIVWHDYGNEQAEVTDFLKDRSGLETVNNSWLAFQRFGASDGLR